MNARGVASVPARGGLARVTVTLKT
jgi:hypothetical protein